MPANIILWPGPRLYRLSQSLQRLVPFLVHYLITSERRKQVPSSGLGERTPLDIILHSMIRSTIEESVFRSDEHQLSVNFTPLLAVAIGKLSASYCPIFRRWRRCGFLH